MVAAVAVPADSAVVTAAAVTTKTDINHKLIILHWALFVRAFLFTANENRQSAMDVVSAKINRKADN
jgi:hypothetical protein